MITLSVSKVRAGLSAAVLVIASFASASYANAQGREIKVNVPFAFENGSQHLPAGIYTLQMQSDHVMLIHGQVNSGLTMTNPQETLRPSQKSKVVFRKYGDQYFLREVWTAASTTHFQCTKSKAEKRLQIARNETPAPQGQEVALLEMPR